MRNIEICGKRIKEEGKIHWNRIIRKEEICYTHLYSKCVKKRNIQKRNKEERNVKEREKGTMCVKRESKRAMKRGTEPKRENSVRWFLCSFYSILCRTEIMIDSFMVQYKIGSVLTLLYLSRVNSDPL